MQLLTCDNAFAERFVRSIRSERLSKLLPIGVRTLPGAVHDYMEHYNRERNHQGVGNRWIAPRRPSPSLSERIDRRRRLGGVLNFYERAAA